MTNLLINSYSLGLLLLIVSFNTSSIVENKTVDIEKLIRQRKIQFAKTDTLDLVNLIGDKYTRRLGWGTLRGMDKNALIHSNTLFLYYEDLDIEFMFKKTTVNNFSNKVDNKYILYKIKIHSCYKGQIHSTIMGKTKFKELPKKIKKQEFNHQIYSSQTIISKNYKNYRFFSKIDSVYKSNTSAERPIFENATIEYIEIRHRKAKKRYRYEIDRMEISPSFGQCE